MTVPASAGNRLVKHQALTETAISSAQCRNVTRSSKYRSVQGDSHLCPPFTVPEGPLAGVVCGATRRSLISTVDPCSEGDVQE